MCKYCDNKIAIIDDENLGLVIYKASNGKDNALIRGYDRRGW